MEVFNKFKNKKILTTGLLAILILTLNFFIAFKLGQSSASNPPTIFEKNSEFKEKYADLFNEVWIKIKNHFVDQSRVNPDKAAFEAIRGLVKSLQDPYSDLYTPEQTKILEEDLRGSFCGVGMEIGIRNGILTVIAPLEDTPAYRIGIKAGDFILKINNEDTSDMSLEEAVSKIRGECGKEVVLTLMREGWEQEREFVIKREEIKVPAIKSEFIKPNIGYIKIVSFGLNTIPEFLKAYNSLAKKGANRFILDLRNNPGGYLEVAIRLSEYFLPRGKIILKEVWGKEQEERIIRSEGPGTLSKLKMVILVNKGSASASEIFAGALRENLGVKLIGEKTFGKGSVQQIFHLSQTDFPSIEIQITTSTSKKILKRDTKNVALKLTVAYWLTPKGIKLEGNGLEPDVKVVDKNPEDKIDEVLQKAISMIKLL
ncbi:MAG: S41 family peptidase [Candidatus Aenigmatarchaeota archaeon]